MIYTCRDWNLSLQPRFEFGAAFQRWVKTILPSPAKGEVVAIDGKTSRRADGVGATPLHMVSAFAAGAQLVLGQCATAEKSNEKTAIPERWPNFKSDGLLGLLSGACSIPNQTIESAFAQWFRRKVR